MSALKPAWARRVTSLRIRIHAARERAGQCDSRLCVWWPT